MKNERDDYFAPVTIIIILLFATLFHLMSR